jgi:hypothetical protein
MAGRGAAAAACHTDPCFQGCVSLPIQPHERRFGISRILQNFVPAKLCVVNFCMLCMQVNSATSFVSQDKLSTSKYHVHRGVSNALSPSGNPKFLCRVTTPAQSTQNSLALGSCLDLCEARLCWMLVQKIIQTSGDLSWAVFQECFAVRISLAALEDVGHHVPCQKVSVLSMGCMVLDARLTW